MNNFRKYAIAAALVLPGVFAFGKPAEASKATLNEAKAKSVNVRSEAKLGDNLLGQIKDDKEYDIKETVSNNGGTWLKIEFDGKEAFVGAPWFNITEETEVTAPSNFREKDSTDSKIIKVLKKGDKVEVLKKANNNYYKVNYDGKEGYLYAPNLDLKENKVVQTQATNYQASNTQTYSNNTQTHSNNSYSAPAPTYSNNTASTSNNSYVGNSSSAKEIIAQRESGGSYNARNGQYIGRYQLSSSYLGGDYSPANQERVADNYVAQRYGSWENALSFWNNNGWY